MSFRIFKFAVLGHVVADLMFRLKPLAIVSGVSRINIQRILKHHKFHPYKLSYYKNLMKTTLTVYNF